MKFYECGNCGFSSPRREEFTLTWCDNCAAAGIKFLVSGFAVMCGSLFGAWIAMRVW